MAGTLQDWINLGVNRLIQNSAGQPYSFVINDLPFNGFGIGLESDSTSPHFGNLDQGYLIPDPLGLVPNLSFSFSIPLALLPHYDYVQRNTSGTYDTGVLGTLGGIEVKGSSNEGFDVPDYHDFWMSFVPEGALGETPTPANPLPTTAEIIPAFHRPELVNYIAQTYAKASGGLPGLNKYDLYRMVQLIDYACARPLSYRLTDTLGGGLPTIIRNYDFSGRNDSRGIPTLDIDVANLSGSLTEIQEWVGKLIGRGTSQTDLVSWDVDNQGTGVADSVWTDPNLPLVTSPEGKPLKILAAPLILDLDGRLNLNAVGDAIQGNDFAAVGSGSYHTRSEAAADSALIRNGFFLPQGLGYGPAEISPAGFFDNGTVAQREARYANFFGFRYGPDFGAGQTTLGGASFNDLLGRYFKERGLTRSPLALTTRIGLQKCGAVRSLMLPIDLAMCG